MAWCSYLCPHLKALPHPVILDMRMIVYEGPIATIPSVAFLLVGYSSRPKVLEGGFNDPFTRTFLFGPRCFECLSEDKTLDQGYFTLS